MRIEYLGPQPHNSSLFAFPFAVQIEDGFEMEGREGTARIVAVWILWFNFAWMVTL